MTHEEIDVILPPVWSSVYLNTARLLKYSIEDNGVCAIISEAGMVQNGALSIVLGWNLIPNDIVLKQPYIIYQLEPLTLPLWQDKLMQKRNLFQNAISIWDYSKVNETYLNEFGYKSSIVTLGFHPTLKEASITEFPDYDVLFVGFLTDRRKRIIEELQQHCCVSIQPRWGKDYTEALGRSKIILNIHQYDIPIPTEQARISYALNNRSFIVTENSIDYPYQNLITCSYDRIIDTTVHFLNNPYEREEKNKTCFDKFEKLGMKAILRTLIDNLILNI